MERRVFQAKRRVDGRKWPDKAALIVEAAQALAEVDRGDPEPDVRADFICLRPEITAMRCWIAEGRVA